MPNPRVWRGVRKLRILLNGRDFLPRAIGYDYAGGNDISLPLLGLLPSELLGPVFDNDNFTRVGLCEPAID